LKKLFTGAGIESFLDLTGAYLISGVLKGRSILASYSTFAGTF